MEEVALLVVAGHDSSGGAGVDADCEIAARLGARCARVVTAWTVQGAHGLEELGEVAPASWLREARALLEERPHALKFGLLPGAAHIDAACELVRDARETFGAELPVVMDPVIGASRGGRFLSTRDVDHLRRSLVALRPVLTPNLAELAELAGESAETLADEPVAREAACRRLLELGARAVVAKGGHGREDPLIDLVVEQGSRAQPLRRPRLPGPGIRGSGCRHASALAVELARGTPLAAAATRAGELVAACIRGA